MGEMNVPAEASRPIPRLLYLFPLLVLFFPPVLWAQHRPLRFGHLSIEQGLSQSTVQAIAQDSKGLMWFVTEDGLNRYDGYSFIVTV